jgi:prophage regulatory protein
MNTAQSAAPAEQSPLMKLPAVKAHVAKSTSAIYAEMSQGLFPKPIKTGGNSVAWLRVEIESWIQSKIADRDEVSK